MNTMTIDLDENKITATQDEIDTYNNLLTQVKSSITSLVYALHKIKHEMLYVKVAGYQADEWNQWLLENCPIKPSQAQLYLTAVDNLVESKKISENSIEQVVNLVKKNPSELMQIIKNPDGEIDRIQFDNRSGKFLLHVNELVDGVEVTKKYSIEQYIDKLVAERLAKSNQSSTSEPLSLAKRLQNLKDEVLKISSSLLKNVSMIASEAAALGDSELFDPVLVSNLETLLDMIYKSEEMLLSNFPDLANFKKSKQKSPKTRDNLDKPDNYGFPSATDLSDSQKQILAEMKSDYEEEFLHCIRDFENAKAGYSHKEGDTLYVVKVAMNKDGELYSDVYMNGNPQTFCMDLIDIQSNYEIISDSSKRKKARKLFAGIISANSKSAEV